MVVEDKLICCAVQFNSGVDLMKIFPFNEWCEMVRPTLSGIKSTFVVCLVATCAYGAAANASTAGDGGTIAQHGSSQKIIIDVDVARPPAMAGDRNIANIRRYLDGASWERPISQDTSDRIKPIGIKKLRLINIESNVEMLGKVDGSVSKYDFRRLALALADCRKYHLIPHIVVGQKTPPSALIFASDSGGPTLDTNAYADYAYSLLHYVVVQQGFSSASFEVGNEPDTSGTRWLSRESGAKGGMSSYTKYLQLYTLWSNAADRLAREYPSSLFRLGGPAITPYTLSYGQVDWAKQFIADVARNKLRLDFFSFHSYGDQDALPGAEGTGPYPSVAQRVTYYRRLLTTAGLKNTSLYVTEWGPSSNVDAHAYPINGNNVGAAWSALFMVAMAESGVDEGMLLVLRDEPGSPGGRENRAWPALLLSDGRTPKPLYNVALAFSKMADRGVYVDGDNPHTRVIASADRSKITIMAINSDWDFRSNADLSKETSIATVVRNIDRSLINVRISQYAIDALNSSDLQQNIEGTRPCTATCELTKVDDRLMRVSSGEIGLPVVKLPSSSVTLIEISRVN